MQTRLLLLAFLSLITIRSKAQTNGAENFVTIDSAKVFQDENYTGRENKNEPILHAVIKTRGEGQLAVSEINLTVNGTTNVKDIPAIKIYNTGNSDRFDPRNPSGELLATSKASKGMIRAKAKGIDGLFDREREPLAACERLIKKWDLKNADGEDVELNHNNIREQMPLCLLDAVYGEIWPRMYPSQARLSFLPQSVA